MEKKLGFGCMRLPLLSQDDPTSIDDEHVKQMFDLFLDRGFTYFDTAWMYHGHESENAVRRCLVERHPRDSFTVASKMPTMMLTSAKEQEEIFNTQLQKVGVDYFDYYLAHNINGRTYPVAQKFNTFDFIAQKKAEGTIKHIGFSFHDKAELLEQVLTDHPEAEFVQLQINYLDWDDGGVQARRCYECAVKHGKKVVVMEPVKGGMLARLEGEEAERLAAMDAQATQASWAIRFAASLPEVQMVLSGMSSLEQVDENTQMMLDAEALSDDERAALLRIAWTIHERKDIPCTACQYCVAGCPMDIPIPTYFSLFNEKKRHPDSGHPQMYYTNISASSGKAGECIRCRRCVVSCPQQIQIPEMLADVAKVFETEA